MTIAEDLIRYRTLARRMAKAAVVRLEIEGRPEFCWACKQFLELGHTGDCPVKQVEALG